MLSRIRTIWAVLATAALVLAALGSTGCAPGLRFDTATQASLAKSDMRRLETESLAIYYPAERRDEALRVATRFEACVHKLRLRALVESGTAMEKPRIVMPDAPLNNAYVLPRMGGFEPIGVVPTYNTVDIFATLGIAPDPSFIGCHELTHYIQSNQVHGFPNVLNNVLGELFTPQLGLDSWFWEGIAVYYETRLQGGSARLGSPFWRGLFAAGIQTTQVNGGTLQEFTREIPFGGNYLIGSHFIDYLVRTYGEEKLWKVIYNQGNSFWFPLGVDPRFGNVYGKSLSSLIDEFAIAIKKDFPGAARPEDQHVVREAGFYARYTCSATGRDASIWSSLEDPPRITVRDAVGNLVSERTLIDVVPPRTLRVASALETSGISFNARGNAVYFVSVDQGDVQQVARLVKYDVASESLTEIATDITGSGGSIDPDERFYYFSRSVGDEYALARFDLKTKETTVLRRFGPRTYILGPRVSPDGKRIVATFFDGVSFRIAVFDIAGNYLTDVDPPEGIPTSPGGGLARAPKLDPQWIDAARITYTAESEGRFQVYVADIDQKKATRISRVPYLASSPCGVSNETGARVRFLNREGWAWSLDEIAVAKSTVEARPLPSLGKSSAYDMREPIADAPEPRVINDAPYSRLEHLFVPQIRYPSLRLVSTLGQFIGAGVGGGDRLGFHRWQIDADINVKTRFGGAAFSYILSEFAPWYVVASAAHESRRDDPAYFDSQLNRDPSAPVLDQSVRRYETAAQLSVVRPFNTSLVSLGAVYDDLKERGVTSDHRGVGGAIASLSYQGAEYTSYAGVRRALAVSLQGTFFPANVGTLSYNTEDVRAQVTLVLPLPLSNRHTLLIQGRTRHVLGKLDSAAPLQVGGGGRSALLTPSLKNERNTDLPLPPAFQFYETLRGFEDLSFYSSRVGIAEIAYRYPIIFDVGSASSLWLFPRSYLAQLDVELFGVGATFYDRTTSPLAVGGALTLQMLLLGLPLDLRVQVSKRLNYDQNWVPIVTIGGPL